MYHRLAHCVADRLVPEADAEYGKIVRRRLDQSDADTSFPRRARARGKDDTIWFQRERFLDGGRVVANDVRSASGLFDIVYQVPGEAVIIVDDEDHWSNS